nr:PIN domain-containing protein [Longimicrobium terrae]
MFPFQLRNFLLHASTFEIFEPLWSEDILNEIARHLPEKAGLNAQQISHLLDQMQRAFPGALGTGYTHLIEGLALPDADDRHVLALAVHYEAEFIVTHNVRDFPNDRLAPWNVQALTADDFIQRLSSTHEDQLRAAAEQHRLSLKRAPYTPEQYLDSLRSGFLPRFADRLAAQGFLAQRQL